MGTPSRAKQKIESESQIAGKILADFLNKKDISIGVKRLIVAARDSLGIKIPKGFIRSVQENDIDALVKEKDDLSELFKKINESTNLYKVEKVHDFVVHYNFRIRPFVEVEFDGTLCEGGTLDPNTKLTIDDIIAYLVITFVRSEKCIGRAIVCAECERYSISSKSGNNKYCRGRQCSNRADRKIRAERKEEEERAKGEQGGAIEPQNH